MTRLQNKYRNNIWRMRIVHRHWKVQQQFQGWETKVFQLQQVQTHSKGMPIKEKKEKQGDVSSVTKKGI